MTFILALILIGFDELLKTLKNFKVWPKRRKGKSFKRTKINKKEAEVGQLKQGQDWSAARLKPEV